MEHEEILLQEKWAKRWEGIRRVVYLDTKKIPTIAVGLNLTTPQAQRMIAALGLDMNAVLAGKVSLTDDQINNILDNTLYTAETGARAIVSNYDALPRNQRLVVTDLVFNMGETTFGKFHNTIKFIEAGNFKAAAANLKLSAWCYQVGSGVHQRGGANVSVLAGDTEPELYL